MKEFLLKIFNSEIMHYVVVPIVVPIVVALLGWMKNKHDLKEKNKELGYWMMKWRKLPTFQELALKNYKIFAMNLVIMSIVRLVFVFWKGRIFSYIVSGILYFGLNGIVVFLNCRSANSKMELWKCIFRKNCASVPEERSAIPLQTEQSSAGLLVTVVYSTIPARKFKTICLGCHSA